MPVLPMVEPANEPAELKPVFDQLRATRGRVPGMYRTLAHQPAVLAAHRQYFHAALDSGILPRLLKEKVAYKVARLRQSPYCTGSHGSYAVKHGGTPEELACIDRGDYSGLAAREAAALALAEAAVGAKTAVSGDVLAGLQQHFSTAEIVELLSLIGIMELACSLAGWFDLQAD